METRDNHKPDPGNRHENDENIKNNLASHADDLGINETVSGEDRLEEGHQERRHHEMHGNRKYKSHSNHSSADDQPMTDTGA